MARTVASLLVAGCCCLGPGVASAALSDEIQVYTDDINAPGEFGLEMHVNTTPEGRKTPDYSGEVTPHHGVRVTPEFSYGLTKTLEAGLYIPTNHQPGDNFDVAGWKARLKWLPVRGDEQTGGWFLGANGEFSRLQRKYSESPTTAELRIMMGHRSPEWLFAVNPVFGFNLSEGFSHTPEFELGVKVARSISERLALGLEYYSAMGAINHIQSLSQQDNTLFAAMDLDMKAWTLNFGVGRGLTSEADKWTVKAIFGFSF